MFWLRGGMMSRWHELFDPRH